MGCFVKSIQRGTASLTGGTVSVTLPETVDTSKTIFFFSAKCAQTTGSMWDTLVQMVVNSSTQITFTRAGNTGTTTISWEYIQFTAESDVIVQHGTVIMNATSVTAALGTTVDVNKSWIMISWQKNTTSMTQVTFAKAKFTSSAGTSITLESTTNMSYAVANLSYQVIQYGDCSVQTLELSNQNAQNATQAISSIDTTKTVTFSSCKGTASQTFTAAMIFRVTVDSATAIRYQKYGAAGNGFDITTFVVTFTDSTLVRHYTATFASATDTSINTTITATPMARTITNQSRCNARGLSSSDAANSVATYSLHMSQMTTSTNITTSKVAVGSNSIEALQVISFYNGGPFWTHSPVSSKRRYLRK